MSTTDLAAILVGGPIIAAVIIPGFIAVAAIALQWLILRTTERLARAGRLDEHGVRILPRQLSLPALLYHSRSKIRRCSSGSSSISRSAARMTSDLSGRRLSRPARLRAMSSRRWASFSSASNRTVNETVVSAPADGRAGRSGVVTSRRREAVAD